MDRERVVITGVGAVTPLGHDLKTSWDALLQGKSGAARIRNFDPAEFSVRFACEVKDWDGSKHIEQEKRKEMDRFTEFAMVAAQEAITDAQLTLTEEQQESAGCFIGVGFGGLWAMEKAAQTIVEKGPSHISPYAIPGMMANMAAAHVSMRHKLKGPSFGTTSACATGAHAIGEAAEWIRRGKANVMVAGGAEATITAVGFGGFQAMYALSRRNDAPEKASRPFDKHRDGFVCGEGAGILVLESLTRAKARGARIYGELRGYGASSDAHHLTGPAPEGEGCQRSMRMALRDAGLAPEAIGYLNAHATSTPPGDRAEAEGILRVFGAHAADHRLSVSATKSMTGHLLGAAGAVEAIFALLALHRGLIPPTINSEEQDPACPIDIVPNVAREKRVQHVLSNAFGFGGTNASLIISAV